MFITSVDGMPRPSPLLSCRPNVHFFIVEAVESRYGQRAAYTDETRKFLLPIPRRKSVPRPTLDRRLTVAVCNPAGGR